MGFYGEPTRGPPKYPYVNLVYYFRVGTRSFEDEYHDGNSNKGEIPIVQIVRMIYDYYESRKRRNPTINF